MSRKRYYFFPSFILTMILLTCGCSTKNIILFRDAAASKQSAVKELEYEHLIIPDDRILISIWGHPELSNEIVFSSPSDPSIDVNIVSAGSGSSSPGGTAAEDKAIPVDRDGNLALPLIGNVMLKGLTITQANNLVKEKYSVFYKDLYVKLRIVNKHVTVLGEVTVPSLVPLRKEQTTLAEVLASVGDFTFDANRKDVKIIRGNLKNPTIIIVDITSKDILQNADGFIVHADDIIYIEPIKRKVTRRVLADLLPYLTIASTTLALVNIVLLSTKR